jgi:hypothetical protein
MSSPPLLRTSERGDFKRCQWRWDVLWNKGLRPKREPTWAWFGSAIHVGLSVRYPIGKKRGSRADTLDAFEEALDNEVRRVYTEGGELEEEEVVDGKELGREMLLGYIEEFGEDSHWQVIENEQVFQIDVPHPKKKGATLVVYCGTWDLVIYDLVEKVYKVVDHKTRKQFPTNWEFYTINDQAGGYLWVAPEVLRFKGVFKKNDVIEGLVFNALRKAMPDTRPLNAQGLATNNPKKEHYVRALEARNISYPPRATVAVLQQYAAQAGLTVLGEPSARQPVPRYHREEVVRTPQERVTQALRVQAEAVQMDFIRRGKMQATKTPTEDCVRCPIFDYCQLHEQDPEAAEEYAAGMYIKRDPYRDHREDMEKKGGVSVGTT